MSGYCEHGKRLLTQPRQKCPDCDYEDLEAENERLQSQNTKLREALEKIANPEFPVNALVLMRRAQQALEETK